MTDEHQALDDSALDDSAISDGAISDGAISDGAISDGAISDDRSDEPVTPAELLRQALVDDEDPRFPVWLPFPGISLAIGWAAYQAIAGDAGVLPTLGVSTAIFAGTTVATWLGWQLDID